MEKIYFPNLNGVRFIAAALVIIHHIELTKYWLHLANNWNDPSVVLIGKLGVVLFFVLSGFLITYLLLAERKNTGTIAVRSFYMRRILRIWPLYYLLVILCFFVFPNISFIQLPAVSLLHDANWGMKFILFMLFLPNVALIWFPQVPFLSQGWSVGVEEQFYLIWPLLMKFTRNTAKVLYGIIVSYLLIKIVGFKILEHFAFWNSTMDQIKSLVGDFSIDCMAIGGVFAYYLFHEDDKLSFFFNIYVQWVVICVLLFLILMGIHIPYFHYEVYAILFGILILNLAGNSDSLLHLENPAFRYLGKISYGLYMYHMVVIAAVLKLLNTIRVTSLILQYSLVFVFSIAVASISYHFFERYFLQLKRRFSRLVTGDNVLPEPPGAIAEYEDHGSN